MITMGPFEVDRMIKSNGSTQKIICDMQCIVSCPLLNLWIKYEYYSQTPWQKKIGRRISILWYLAIPTCRFYPLECKPFSWIDMCTHLADLLPSFIRNPLQDYRCSHRMVNGATFDITRITLLLIWEIAWTLWRVAFSRRRLIAVSSFKRSIPLLACV